jgi:hypothetical protein
MSDFIYVIQIANQCHLGVYVFVYVYAYDVYV